MLSIYMMIFLFKGLEVFGRADGDVGNPAFDVILTECTFDENGNVIKTLDDGSIVTFHQNNIATSVRFTSDDMAREYAKSVREQLDFANLSDLDIDASDAV